MGISNEQLEQLEQIMEDIPYLIKFQGPNSQYAKSLVEMGELHMCSAQYYADQERISGIRGQGDQYENEIMGFIHVDMGCPIYCMYAVYKQQCKANEILIDKRLIRDFCPVGGYITICETMPFINQINSVYVKGFDIGLVTYGNQSIVTGMKLLEKRRAGHYFKKPDLNYQQEFRIVLDERLEQKELPEDRRILVAKDGTKFWRTYEYGFRNLKIGSIAGYSEQLSITELEEGETDYKVKIRKNS